MFTSPKLRAPFQIVRGTPNKLPAQGRSTTLIQPFVTLTPWSQGRQPASAPPCLGGLAELGPVEPFSGDLSLELGISVWLRTSGTSLMEARSSLLEIRQRDPRGLRARPGDRARALWWGAPPGLDVVNLVGYVSELLRRASARAWAAPSGAVVDRVVVELPVRGGRGARAPEPRSRRRR